MRWQNGDLMDDNQVERVVRYARLKYPGLSGGLNDRLDLAMRKAVFRAEIGHPWAQKDAEWITRYLSDKTRRLSVIEARKALVFPRAPKRSDYPHMAKVPTSDFPVAQHGEVFSVAIVHVVDERCCCILQDGSGRYFVIEYGGGIVYTNYRNGDFMWVKSLDRRIGSGAVLIRKSGEQSTQISRVAEVTK